MWEASIMWPSSQTPSFLSFIRKHFPPHVSSSLSFKGPVYGGKKNTRCECHDLLTGPALRCWQRNNKLLISMRDQRANPWAGETAPVKSIGHSGCSSKGPHSVPGTHMAVHHCLVTPVPGDMASLHRQTCRQNTNIHFFLRKKEKQERTKPRAFRLLSSLCQLRGRVTPKFCHLAMRMPFAC